MEKPLEVRSDRVAKQKSLGVVSAWCSENRLILGQVKISDKSNEITAIPELLKRLLIAGGIITIDAAGCQSNIAA